MRQTRSDMVIGAGLLAFSAFAAWRTLKIPSSGGGNTIANASFLPWMMIGAIGLLAIALIVRATRPADVDHAIVQAGAGREEKYRPNTANLLRILAFVILLTAYAAAFMTVGYLPATFVVFVAGMLLMGERRPLMLLVLPALITLAVWYGFTRFLQVWLP
nr:tripartite tricarboxylate transporter TctB family protein [Rhizobium sp. TCK]